MGAAVHVPPRSGRAESDGVQSAVVGLLWAPWAARTFVVFFFYFGGFLESTLFVENGIPLVQVPKQNENQNSENGNGRNVRARPSDARGA
jgi:hypothetical protein